MSFQDELGAVVAEIRTEALRRYEWENETLFNVNDDATAVDPIGPVDQQTERAFQGWLDTFVSYIDALEARFATYYELDPLDLTLIAGRLGNSEMSDVSEVSTSDLTGAAVSTVAGRLHHADAQWVTPLAEPIEDQDSPNYGYSYWSGSAATEFNNQFLTPFRGACERQMAYASVLGFVARVMHDAVAATKADLLAIARACRDELHSYRERRDFNTAGFLTVAGIAASAVALAPSLPVLATTALGATSIGTSVLSMMTSTKPERPVEWEVTGLDAAEILASCADQITKMENELAGQDRPVAALLNALADANPGELERPAVADNPAGFGHVNSTDQQVVVAEVQEIYRAGFVALPAAADDYDQAHRYLYMNAAPRSVELVFPSSYRPFASARANLGAALIKARNSLLDAGTALVQIAGDYGWTDAASEDRFTQYRDGLEPAPPTTDQSSRPVRGAF